MKRMTKVMKRNRYIIIYSSLIITALLIVSIFLSKDTTAYAITGIVAIMEGLRKFLKVRKDNKSYNIHRNYDKY